jgi:hypothetical protein
MIMSKGNMALMWSGGFDSTLLYLDHYAEIRRGYYAEFSKDGNLASHQQEIEEKVRASIVALVDNQTKPLMDKVGEFAPSTLVGQASRHNLGLRTYEYECLFSYNNHYPHGQIGQQSTVWAMALLGLEEDTVMMGYIYGDSYWMIKDKFESSVNNLRSLEDRSPLKFEYPLALTNKPMILCKLHGEYPEVYDILCDGAFASWWYAYKNRSVYGRTAYNDLASKLVAVVNYELNLPQSDRRWTLTPQFALFTRGYYQHGSFMWEIPLQDSNNMPAQSRFIEIPRDIHTEYVTDDSPKLIRTEY